MSIFKPLTAACQCGLQTVIQQYLAPDRTFQMGESESCGLRGVQVTMTRIGNRTGVPNDAQTILYTFACEDFDAVVRSAWAAGFYVEPRITHTALLSVSPDMTETWEALASWLQSA